MADICYAKGHRIVLDPKQSQDGRWTCRFTISEWEYFQIGRYQDYPSGSYKTEGHAKMAAFEEAKNVIDSYSVGQ